MQTKKNASIFCDMTLTWASTIHSDTQLVSSSSETSYLKIEISPVAS